MLWRWHHQGAWVSCWQYFRSFCRKSLPADSRHVNGYELCPSSHRHLSVFIRSGIHKSLLSTGKKQLASLFNLTYRYIDDVLSINDQEFENYLDQMYPAELEIKDTTESITSASDLDLLTVDREGWSTSHFHLRQTRWFQLPHHKPFLLSRSSNIPSSPTDGVFISQLIRYARACSPYEYFIMRTRRLFSKLLIKVCLLERLKSSFRKFYGRCGDLIQQYEASLSRMLNDILTLDHLQWFFNRSDFPTISWPWYRAWPSPNYEWFSWSICNGCVMPAGNAYPSGHLILPPPPLGLAYARIVETSFPEFAVSFLDFSPDIPLGTFSILHPKIKEALIGK